MIKIYIKQVANAILGRTNYGDAWSKYTHDALSLARAIDCVPEELSIPQQHPERIKKEVSQRACNWYLPQFDNPFYAGVMTILRLAEYIQRIHGIKQRFLICGDADISKVRANLVKAFPSLSESDVIILNTVESIENIPESDYSVATLWTTAYVLLGINNTGYKFYMIQDFEPEFYPAGSTYAQAELTYRFGFYGICNTQSLKHIYERDYQGNATVLEPSIDKNIFHPGESLPSFPKRLFYYARPGTPRNGFELAAATLQRLKEKYGDSLEIICAGAGWKPRDYGLEGIVNAIGMIPFEETANLYRSCHAGFVMMMTEHPSYLPFELMACGAIVVTNYNPANTWLLKDGDNCLLSPPSVSCLTATLSYALDNYDELLPLRERASNLISSERDSWDVSLSNVADFMFNPTADTLTKTPFGSNFLSIRNS